MRKKVHMKVVFAFGFYLKIDDLNDSRGIVDDFLESIFAEGVVIHEIFIFLL